MSFGSISIFSERSSPSRWVRYASPNTGPFWSAYRDEGKGGEWKSSVRYRSLWLPGSAYRAGIGSVSTRRRPMNGYWWHALRTVIEKYRAGKQEANGPAGA